MPGADPVSIPAELAVARRSSARTPSPQDRDLAAVREGHVPRRAVGTRLARPLMPPAGEHQPSARGAGDVIRHAPLKREGVGVKQRAVAIEDRDPGVVSIIDQDRLLTGTWYEQLGEVREVAGSFSRLPPAPQVFTVRAELLQAKTLRSRTPRCCRRRAGRRRRPRTAPVLPGHRLLRWRPSVRRPAGESRRVSADRHPQLRFGRPARSRPLSMPAPGLTPRSSRVRFLILFFLVTPGVVTPGTWPRSA